jgi:outer membrane protein OmpA-like peptidoglycan-associated protein
MLSLLFAGQAKADPVEGWYAAVEGGAVWMQAWDHIRTQTSYCYTTVKPASADFATGWAGLGTIGYGMNHWRVEVEGGYRRNNLDGYEKNGWAFSNVSGDVTQVTAMMNVLYDVPLLEKLSLDVGIGVGGDYAKIDFTLPGPDIQHESWRLAYQGLAGLTYTLTPNIGVFANYRYLDARRETFDATPSLIIDGEDFQKHTTSVGVRYAFAAPLAAVPVAPPAPAQPAPPAPSEFLIFFGFNKSGLTPQALETVKKAAVASTQLGTASIRVVGHTDRAGSVTYNKALSLRRADAVKKALVAEGVMGSAISIAGRGESEPMKPTADGVREPQNRRVQINF